MSQRCQEETWLEHRKPLPEIPHNAPRALARTQMAAPASNIAAPSATSASPGQFVLIPKPPAGFQVPGCHWVASEAAFDHLIGLARLAETPSGALRPKQGSHQTI